ARGNLAEDARSGAQQGGVGVPPGAWFLSESVDEAEGSSKRSSRRKVRGRKSDGGLRQGKEENQATDENVSG
ncbi:hypothetical protein XENOCAPTIV_018255, partial [Xenoophorus captivus]